MVALLFTISMSAYANDLDHCIESSFTQSFVYKTYLKEEHITIASKEGVVSLSGDVLDDTHKPAEAIIGVKSVIHQIIVQEKRLPENSDTWIKMQV